LIRGADRGSRFLNNFIAGVGPPLRPTTGIFIVGMHRSGTSAVTRIVNLFGVPLGMSDDLQVPDQWNAKGYWESSALTVFQEYLLHQLGGTWDKPPFLGAYWEKNWQLTLTVGRARRLFNRVYGDLPVFAWKDPRTSITLPFWRRALAPKLTIPIVVHRDPYAVACSLSERDNMHGPTALALWERYNNAVLNNVRDLKPLFVAYEHLIADPDSVSGRIYRFLRDNGVPVTPPAEAPSTFISSALRHHGVSSASSGAGLDLTKSQISLAGRLQSLTSN
jgi:hypothetical protein